MSERRGTRWGKAVPWIALGIGLYGAVLSTFHWLDIREERARRLEVKLFFDAPIARGLQYPPGLAIKGLNPGHQRVVVTTAAVFLPDGHRFCVDRARNATGDWTFPIGIGPGENATVLLAGDDLAALCETLLSRGFDGKVTLVGFYEDALGKHHKSDPLQFDVADALKLAHAQTGRPASGGVSEEPR